jgi:hypothetical protein
MYNVMLLAAEAGGQAGGALDSFGGLGGIITAVVAAVMGAFLLPLLKNKSAAAKAEAERIMADADATKLEKGKALLLQLKAFLLEQAGRIAEKEFPKLAGRIAAGEFKDGGVDKVKAILRGWGKDLRIRAIEYFEKQGIDIVAEVGDDVLDDLIDMAANKVSPFPGRETARILLKERVSDTLVDKGVDWMRERYLHADKPENLPSGTEAGFDFTETLKKLGV